MPDNKSPHFIDWAVTRRCNLKCRHCRGMPADELSGAKALELADEICELKPGWVIIEGGEPLLYPDIRELLERFSRAKIPVHLITNGMLFDPGLAAAMPELGVRVMVSIDGASKQTYEQIRAGADFDTALDSTRAYARAGLLGAVNFTVLKSNYREITDFFRLAESLGAPRINFFGLKPCQEYRAELLSPNETETAVRAACAGAQETGLDFFFDEPFFHALVKEWNLPLKKSGPAAGIILPSTSACIIGEYLFIDPTGQVKPCTFSPESVAGVKDRSLKDIWAGLRNSDFWNQVKDPRNRKGRCATCKYLMDCKGCRARTFILTQDWLAADPACPLNKITASN